MINPVHISLTHVVLVKTKRLSSSIKRDEKGLFYNVNVYQMLLIVYDIFIC